MAEKPTYEELEQKCKAFEKKAVESKQLEKALLESRHNLEVTQRLTHLGSWSWNTDSNEVFCSGEMLRIWGYPPEKGSLTFQEVMERIHPEDRDRVGAALQCAINEESRYEAEFRIGLPDGTERIILGRGRLDRTNKGKSRVFRGTGQDITTQKLAEKALKKSEQRYRTLFETMTQGVVYQDAQGKIISANPVAEKILGLSIDQMQGRTSVDPRWKSIHEDGSDFPGEKHPSMVALKTGKMVKDIIMGVFNPVTERNTWISITAVPHFKRGQDCPYQVYTTFDDITKRKQEEEKLRKSQHSLAEAQAMAHVGGWEWDILKGEVEWSDEVYRIFGLDSRHFQPQIDSVMERFHPDDRSKHEELIEKSLANRETYSFDARVIRPNGSVREVVSTSQGRYDIKGRLTKIVGSVHDITDRKQIEMELREVLGYNEKIISESPVGLAIYDAESGQCISANDSIAELVGATKEQVYTQNFYEIRSWKKSGLLKAALTSLEENAKRDIIVEVTTTFGRELAIDCNFTPFSYKKKRHLMITAMDITRRIQAEKDAIEQKQVAERYLNIAGVMFIGLDIQGNVTLANQKACSILECRETDIIGRNWFEHFIPQAIRHEVRSVFNKLIKGDVEPVEYYENLVISKNGQEKYIAWHNTYIKGLDGEILGVLGSGEDITEKRELETQLIQTQKMESIGNLAGGIAHDFNNILASIIGFTELALDDAEKGSNLEDNLQEVFTAGKRARDLVKQILAFARQSDEEVKPVQVDSVIKENLKLLRSSIPTTIEIKESIASGSLIMGNAIQVEQIVMNLCTNAAHAMENQGGILEVSLKDLIIDKNEKWKDLGLKPGDFIELKISDTGPGISPEIISSIFEPYFTTKGPGEGTGMGLALVHGIVESYNGKITVHSQVGEGTTFTIYLPVTKRRGIHRPYQTEELPTGKECILFVDDEAPIANMGGQILTVLGYSVTTTTSSLEALELFQSKPGDFDLVVTDMTMPNMTGDILAAELMTIRPDIPVILCTGYSKKISDDSAADIGIKAFTYKPLAKADLAKTVRKVLDEAQGTALPR